MATPTQVTLSRSILTKKTFGRNQSTNIPYEKADKLITSTAYMLANEDKWTSAGGILHRIYTILGRK